MASQIRPKIRPKSRFFLFLSAPFSAPFLTPKIRPKVDFRSALDHQNPSDHMCFTVFARYDAFLRKIVPRSLPDRFLLQKGSQKAPQSGPKWSREPSFFGAVFSLPFLNTFGSILTLQNITLVHYAPPFFGHFFGPSFRTVPGGSPDPLFITFWSHFRPPGSLFRPFFVVFSSLFFAPRPASPPDLSTGTDPQKPIHALPSPGYAGDIEGI